MSELLFKVIIIGDATVGKTSFVQRYVNNYPRREYKPTVGGRNKMFVFIFARSVDEPVTKFKVERLQVEKNWEKKPEQCQQKVLIGSFHIIRPHFSISHTNRILYRKLEATMKVGYVQSTPDN